MLANFSPLSDMPTAGKSAYTSIKYSINYSYIAQILYIALSHHAISARCRLPLARKYEREREAERGRERESMHNTDLSHSFCHCRLSLGLFCLSSCCSCCCCRCRAVVAFCYYQTATLAAPSCNARNNFILCCFCCCFLCSVARRALHSTLPNVRCARCADVGGPRLKQRQQRRQLRSGDVAAH